MTYLNIKNSTESSQLRKLAFKVIHSTTKTLPVWYKCLLELKLKERLMPRDVATRWNLTFDMLDFALESRKAIDMIAEDRDMGLCQFELSTREWEIAGQLRDVLQVCLNSHDRFPCSCICGSDPQTRDSVLFAFHTKP